MFFFSISEAIDLRVKISSSTFITNFALSQFNNYLLSQLIAEFDLAIQVHK